MNFRIIDGDDDYLEKVPEFVEEYNRNYLTVPKLCEKLDLSINEYRKLRKHCLEEGLIILRRRQNKRKPNHKTNPKNYSLVFKGRYNYWKISKNSQYYCSCKSEAEAKEIVRRLEACDWDINSVDSIKESVCG